MPPKFTGRTLNKQYSALLPENIKKYYASMETSGDISEDWLQLERDTFEDLKKRGKIRRDLQFEALKTRPKEYDEVADAYIKDLKKTFRIPTDKEAALWSWRPGWYKKYGGKVENIPETKKGVFKKTGRQVMEDRKKNLNKYLSTVGEELLSMINPFSVTEAHAGTNVPPARLMAPGKPLEQRLQEAMPPVELPGGVQPIPQRGVFAGGSKPLATTPLAQTAEISLQEQKQDIRRFGQLLKSIATYQPRFEQIAPSFTKESLKKGFGELIEGLSFPLRTMARVPSALQAGAMPFKGVSRVESAARAFLRPGELPAGYLGGEVAKKMNPQLWPVAGAIGALGELLSYEIAFGNLGKRLASGYKRAKIKGVESEINEFVDTHAKKVVDKMDSAGYFPRDWNEADKIGRVKTWMKEKITSNPEAGKYFMERQTPAKIFTEPFRGKVGTLPLEPPGKPDIKALGKGLPKFTGKAASLIPEFANTMDAVKFGSKATPEQEAGLKAKMAELETRRGELTLEETQQHGMLAEALKAQTTVTPERVQAEGQHELVAHVNIRGAETTVEEGYFMRPPDPKKTLEKSSKLEGSESQVKFANDIIKDNPHFVETINSILERVPASQKEAVKKSIDSLELDKAKTWIEHRSDDVWSLEDLFSSELADNIGVPKEHRIEYMDKIKKTIENTKKVLEKRKAKELIPEKPVPSVPELKSTGQAEKFGAEEATPAQIDALKKELTVMQARTAELRAKGENTTDAEDAEGFKLGQKISFYNEAVRAHAGKSHPKPEVEPVPAKFEGKAKKGVSPPAKPPAKPPAPPATQEEPPESPKFKGEAKASVKIKLLKGRETKLDSERISIEKQMSLIEKHKVLLQKAGRSTKAVDNKLQKLSKDLEAIHFQLGDVRDLSKKELEREKIELKGKEISGIEKAGEKTGKKKTLLEVKRKEKLKEEKRLRKEGGKPISERAALKRSLRRQSQAARKAAVEKKKEVVEIMKTIAKIKRTPVEGMGYEERAKIEELKKQLKTTRTREGLRALFQQIDELKKIGKAKYIQTIKLKNELFALDKEILLKTQGTGEILEAPRTRERKRLLGKKRKRRLARASTLRPSRIFDAFDKGQGFEGPHNEYFYNRVNRAVNKEIEGINFRKEKLFAFLQEKGIKLDFVAQSRKVAGEKFTISEMMGIYNSLKNPEKKRAMIFGNKISQELANKVIAQMSDTEKAIADFIMADYEENWPRLRKAFIDFTDGKHDLGKVVGYSPIKRLSMVSETLDQELAKELTEREGLRKAYTERGFTKERIQISEKHQTPIRLDEVELWFDFIQRQEHFISHGTLVKEMQRMVNDSDFANSLIYNKDFGKEYHEAVRNWVNRVANPNLYKAMTQIEKVAQTMRQNAAVAYLGFNIVTVGKQFPSIALFLNEAQFSDMAGAIGQLVTDYKNSIEFIHEHSPQLKTRSIERELEELKQNHPEAHKKIIAKVGSAGMRGIYEMDKIVVSVGWLGVFNKCTKMGMSEVEAAEMAEKAVLRTQPAAHAKDVADIYATNEFLNWFTQFSNQLSQIYNIVTYDIPMRARTGKQSDALRGAFGVVMSALMIYMLSKGRIPDKDDVKDFVAETTLNMIPIVGRMLNSARIGFDAISVPALSSIKTLGQTTNYLVKGFSKKKPRQRIEPAEYRARALEKGLETIALIYGIPFSQPKRSIKGALELQAGETEDARRLIWSEGSLKQKEKIEEKKETKKDKLKKKLFSGKVKKNARQKMKAKLKARLKKKLKD